MAKILYEKIRKEFPNSWEARHAAWRRFPSLKKNDDDYVVPFANDDLAWIDGCPNRTMREILGKGYIADDDSKTRRSIEKQINEIRQNMDSVTSESLRNQIDTVRKTAHTKLKTNNDGADLLNFLDDVSQFLDEPDATLTTGIQYINLSVLLQGFTHFNDYDYYGYPEDLNQFSSLLRDYQSDPAFKNLHDYLDFLNIEATIRQVVEQPILASDGETYEIPNYAGTEKLTRAIR